MNELKDKMMLAIWSSYNTAQLYKDTAFRIRMILKTNIDEKTIDELCNIYASFEDYQEQLLDIIVSWQTLSKKKVNPDMNDMSDFEEFIKKYHEIEGGIEGQWLMLGSLKNKELHNKTRKSRRDYGTYEQHCESI